MLTQQASRNFHSGIDAAGIWAALAFAGAAGLWAERTKWGKEMSGALISTLVGLALSNLNIIPSEAPHVYGVVNAYLLPLAVPLLLFSANLRRMVKDTGKLLSAFIWGSVATVAGSLLAFKLLPLRGLGADGWKVAAALTARHIGGSVNYVAVSEALSLSPAARMAGLAADDLIVSLYFITLYAGVRGIPPDGGSHAADPAGLVAQPRSQQQQQPQRSGAGAASAAGAAVTGALQQQPRHLPGRPGCVSFAGTLPASLAVSAQPPRQQPRQELQQQPVAADSLSPGADAGQTPPEQGGDSPVAGHSGVGESMEDRRTVTVLHGATALALAAAICFAGSSIAAALRYKGGSITVITAITVVLATAVPRLLAPLTASGEGLAAILMQVFFASVGASGSISVVLATAPALFLWSSVAISAHLALCLLFEKVWGYSRRDMALASNANVGGPTTAAGMAAAKGWRSSLIPALLVGIFGYTTATFVGVGIAQVYRAMQWA
ncbi:hypothetical protein N2152v2_008809 [Parachlorella kessleri]